MRRLWRNSRFPQSDKKWQPRICTDAHGISVGREDKLSFRWESRMARTRNRITVSSGSVFPDLRLPDADEKRTKVQLAVALNQIIEKRQLSQAAAAGLWKTTQAQVSALKNYHLDGFSVERLMHFLKTMRECVAPNEWQTEQIKKGLEEAERGEFATDAQVRRTMSKWRKRVRIGD